MKEKYINMLENRSLTLIVSLPCNNPKLARCAWENGADAVKIHINVEHRASKNSFKSFSEEYENIAQILNDAKGPVGIVLGGDAVSAERDLNSVIQHGFEFISLYAHHTPLSVVSARGITKMLAPDYSYSMDEIRGISKYADVLEASVMHPEEYGTRLTVRDLLLYRNIVSNVNIPVVVPTQKYILPQEIRELKDIGIKGIMIGAIVTGKEKETVERAVCTYKNCILSL